MGVFSGGPVLTQDARTAMPTPVNLNALGRASGLGTCYWHVGGSCGPFGSLGTAWSLVQSLTVCSVAATVPRIGVDPTSLAFWAEKGDTAQRRGRRVVGLGASRDDADPMVPGAIGRRHDGAGAIPRHDRDESVAASDTIVLPTVKRVARAPCAVSAARDPYLRPRCKVVGPQPCAPKASAVTIKVRTLAAVTRATLKLGAQPVSTLLAKRFRCSLPAGSYRFFVCATDGAGTKQATVGSNRLTVR